MAETGLWERINKSLIEVRSSDYFRLFVRIGAVVSLFGMRLFFQGEPDGGQTVSIFPPPPTVSAPTSSPVESSLDPVHTPTLAEPYPIIPPGTAAAASPYPIGIPPGTGGERSTPEGRERPLPESTTEAFVYAPYVSAPNPTSTPTPTDTPTPLPTPTPTIDFGMVRAQLEVEGNNLAFSKIGFHTGVGGNRNGLGEWMRALDSAGVPFFLKSVDDSGPLVEAQEIMRQSDIPHTLVYRTSGDEYDTPDYSLPPVDAARQHWDLHMAAFPEELDKNFVWLETINEVDKNHSEWLGRFAVETARLALRDGYRWAAFGWSSGEPEASDWQRPAMLAYLRLAAENPERLAVALHEYSFTNDNIADQYPFKVGRFQQLFQIADQYGIPRPTVLITEWGWEYDSVPAVGQALQDITWAAELYAPYPEIKGAAVWYLGGGFGGIADIVQPLIIPLMHKNLGTYFAIPKVPEKAPINPEQYRP